MLSNLPPGVSISDYQISGPEWEEEDFRFCPECDQEVAGLTEGFHGSVTFWHDAEDGTQHSVELSEDEY